VKEQEVQLPLRNRASATYFFVAKLLSIAVMTGSYVYHLRSISLRPMKGLIYDAHSFQHATAALSFDVSFLENPCGYPHKLYIARN